MLQTRYAEKTNDIAFRPNTQLEPTEASSSPPMAGPTMIPEFRPSAIKPFAQLRSSSDTRLGIAAPEADQNGVSTTAEANARPSSHPGSCVNAIAAKQPTPSRSDTIITRRRSNRSPSAPARGATNPLTPNVSSNVADSHVGECVSS